MRPPAWRAPRALSRSRRASSRFPAVTAAFAARRVVGDLCFSGSCFARLSAGFVADFEQLLLPRIICHPFPSRAEHAALEQGQLVRQLVQKLLLLSHRLRRLGQSGGELCFALLQLLHELLPLHRVGGQHMFAGGG